MTLNDPEPPKKGFLVHFSHFWLQRTYQEWIATKCLKTDQDNLHIKFSAFLAVQVLTLEVQGGLRTWTLKRGTYLKSGYFTDIGPSSMKTVDNKHSHPTFINHNKH